MFGAMLMKSSLVVAVLGLGSAALAEEAKAPKPYPLQTCVVSGAKVGSMGDPVVHVHEGQEVKFCCAHCVDSFKEDPAKYLAKMEEEAKKQPATQPAEKDDHKASH